MKLANVEIVGSIDPSEMPSRRGGGSTKELGATTQRMLDDAAAGRVTVLRLPKGTSANMAQRSVQGGRNRTLKRHGFRLGMSTRRDTDGTLLVYVHCTPIDQNGHQP
jgi:hypothetical protein